MLLSDIFMKVYVRSGQFLMPMDKIEINEYKFKILVEDAIAFYSEYCPLEDWLMIDVGTPRTYTFLEDGHEFGIPENISKIIPVRVLGVNPMRWAGTNISGSYQIGYSDVARDREFIPYTYRRPKLTVPYTGSYNVLAWFNHRIVEHTNDETGDIYYDLPGITNKDRYFFQYLQAQFLRALGRSRRAFTIDEIPLNMDSEDLVSEADRLEEKAEENILNAQKAYLAFGG